MKRWFILLCCLTVLLSLVAFPASAVVPDIIVDYNDLITDIQVDGENDIVTLDIPISEFWWGARVNDIWATERVGSYLDYSGTAAASIMAFPLGYQNYVQLDVTNIPSGTTCNFSFSVDISSGRKFSDVVFIAYYFDAEGYFLQTENLWTHGYVSYENWAIAASAPLTIPKGAVSCYLRFEFKNFAYDSKGSNIRVSFNNFLFQMSISSLYRQQQLTGKTNKLLDAVQDQLAEQGKTMDDILSQQEQLNDKFDQLPGQIGDEFQDVIDKENDKAESNGNDMVDQVIDIIPNPSTEFLPALENLASALSYDGTDCTITMPTIKVPAISGLFPEMVILPAQKVNFADWFNKFPSYIITLIRALFDVALVYYCFKEFVGLISDIVSGNAAINKELKDG